MWGFPLEAVWAAVALVGATASVAAALYTARRATFWTPRRVRDLTERTEAAEAIAEGLERKWVAARKDLEGILEANQGVLDATERKRASIAGAAARMAQRAEAAQPSGEEGSEQLHLVGDPRSQILKEARKRGLF